MIVTLAQSKGGAGKSTIALNLAATAARNGANTLILDTDPQRTLTDILSFRDEASGLLKYAEQFQASYTISKDLPGQIAKLSQKFDAIFIDTAGFDNSLTWNLVGVSDLVLIPVGLGAADLLVTTKMVQKLSHVMSSSPVKARLVLNQFQPKCRYAGAFVRDLRNLTAIVPKTITSIHARPTYKEAFSFGGGVVELQPTSNAAQEMMNLWTEIKDLLKGA